jgi:hypothetical protein
MAIIFLAFMALCAFIGNKQIICQGETIRENASRWYYNKIYTEC